ncbi:MAG: DNA-directed RNA polymerase subunit omega [Candidatus Riflemargulisbacteria bacterium]
MKPKYDKFLMSYVVAKRAKEILEEGIHYFPKEDQNKNEILEAIKEIEDGIISIEVNKTELPPVKEEADTLELLYSSIKKQKAEEKEELNGGLDELLDIEENEVKIAEPEEKPISLWEEETEEESEDEEIEFEKDDLLIDDLDIEPLVTEEVVIEEDL